MCLQSRLLSGRRLFFCYEIIFRVPHFYIFSYRIIKQKERKHLSWKRGNNMQDKFERVEKKYLLARQQYQLFVQGMKKYTKPDAYANYTICNVYYDTEDFDLIRKSLDGPVYKEKLRVRSYGTPTDNEKVFVEIKKKYDGVVYKRRISTTALESVRYIKTGILMMDSQIKREIDWFLHSHRLIPAAFIRYDREVYSGVFDSELRITFDRNIRGRNWNVDLRKGQEGDLIIPKDMSLLEIKIPGSAPLWLSTLLSQCKAYPISFSKYGTYYKQLIGEEPKIPEREVRKYA